MFEFPEVDVDGGDLKWNLRNSWFSKNDDCHQHETQLGQNYTTPCKEEITGSDGKKQLRHFTVSVVDPQSHWPRMWRVGLNDFELLEMKKMEKKEAKKLEPTNDKPRRVNERIRRLFTRLDDERERNLRHRTEGINFVT